VGVRGNQLVLTMLQEWRERQHAVFEECNVWPLFNAFTEALKEGNLVEPPRQTEALHGLMDIHVGLN